MKLTTFDAAKYLRVRDLPRLLWDFAKERHWGAFVAALKTSGRVIGLAIAALLVSGCAHEQRYVTIHCVTPEQLDELKAAEPPKVGSILSGNAEEDIRPIAGSAVRLRAWGHQVLGVVEGCQG